MSVFSDAESRVELEPRVASPRVQFAAWATALGVLGGLVIWPTLVSLWALWTTDPVKSLGMVIPEVSLVLILREWRSLRWRADGSWWGLAFLLFVVIASRLQQQATLIMVVSPRWSTVLPPPSLMIFIYASGVILLVGGWRLYRAALFPIVLLWFVNPVPSRLLQFVDLPLQHASAHIARAFAIHLGHSLTPDHLRLMFTPDFGMFIAPGCNGIRGSVTMGFIALITGYVYRFRWYWNAAFVTAAILLGYLFNLLRLCMLVLYYMVALHIPSLQDKAENADYVIGAVLFLLATLLLFAAVHRLSNPTKAGEAGSDVKASEETGRPQGQYARLAVLGGTALLGCIGAARAMASDNPFVPKVADASAIQFPSHLGFYTLVRSWSEGSGTKEVPVVYVWGEYSPADGGTPISIGVSPAPNWHDPVLCHFVRGEEPVWHGQLTVATGGGVPVSFSSAIYNDGVTEWLEASTLCRSGNCGEFTTDRDHFGFVYTKVNPGKLFQEDGRKATRVLLRVDHTDLTVADGIARQQMISDLRSFLSSVRLDDLTRPYGR